ncbi:MAG: response regulator [Bacteroidales bacterium]|jgi:signal transduction histidine kinase/ligand-binding sensor domain-containing protein/DNA-binding response OmpR family regulator|nr:response regulator [Bacteroidales bacterium]
MNKTKAGRFFFLSVWLMLYVPTVCADSFRRFNVENGLSSRRVFRIAQDSVGFVWFFTYAGIDRYDGSEIRRYRLSENMHQDDNLLSSAQMICDRNGNIWILMKNGMIYSYDRTKDDYVFRISLADHLPGTPIALYASIFDRDNRLWLCLSSGLYYFDFDSNRPIPVSDFDGEQVMAIAKGIGSEMFVGTHNYVYRLDKKSAGFSIVRLSGLPEARIESLLFHENKLYVGTFSNSVYAVDFHTKETVHLSHLIPNVPVRTIVAANDGRILIGADGSGFYSIDAASNRLLQRYASNEDVATSLSGNTVCDILVDRDHCIWIGTSTNGVSILDPNLPEVNIVRHESGKANSLVSNHVNAILEDSDGDLWYGTNNGISVYSVRNGQWKHFPNESGETSPVVLTLCEDVDGNVWAGGFGFGAWCIDKRSRRVQKLEVRREGVSSGLSTSYIYSIHADDSDVWFGGIEGELTRYHLRTKAFTYYPAGCIGDIKVGGGNTLLFAACAGLSVFHRDNGRTEVFNEFGGVPLNSPVRCLCRASSGDVWLATDGGLIRFHPDKGSSEWLTLEDPYASNSILSVVEDRKKRIWFASENGLYCLDPSNGMIVNMDGYIGMDGETYNANAAVRRRNGNLVFGTANGAVEFSPDFMPDDHDSARLVFTGFMLSYKSLPVGEPPLLQAIDETSSIALKYAQNSFSISFSAINFRQPHKIQYVCKLDGFENEWHEAAGHAGYTNIGPGRYEFKLRAVNKYTKAVIDQRSIVIDISRPWWTSGWTIMICTVLLAVITFLVIQYARTQIEERNSRGKITFFTNIAHDIRTPVALIKAPLSELENEDLTEHGRKTLNTAVRNTEKLFSLVTQLLNFQKADLSEIKMTVSENELYSFMNEKIADFRLAAMQKDIALKMITDFEQLEVYFDRDMMNKIMDNLLSNAIKYTPAGGAVTVTLSHSRKNWSAEVHDTGIGIPAAEQKNLFNQFYRAGNAVNSKETGSGIGLLLIRKLVTLHHGEIQFSSVENRGSVFKIFIPVGKAPEKDDHAAPAGVKTEETEENAPLREKILLVEDNDDMRAYLKSSLMQEYWVTDMPDGRLVAEQIADMNPDIVISDVLMPYLRGDEMCRMLKSNVETSHIPVILLTALSDKENIIMGLESGADDYITKPFDTAVLKARIRNILHNREKLRSAVSSGSVPAEEIAYTNELDKKFMNKALEVIEKDMSDPEFSINEFCLTLGMSRSSFYNKIKTLTGRAPNDFIRLIRLNKARELLKSQRYSVSEVADMVGFSDAKYFSTCFKKQFGVSPSKAGVRL